ncbi:acyltransferase family protein [Tateyamaria armeniaca]|uniref:Acyltransferase family protein n=1 Tax=Tateyamaria armeniaca TaxID=2518930 RepID=A0ABW8UUB2_9RHOB
MTAHPYRSDIDGLRALAVASVVLFHLSEEILPGGYLGVDIFFVISGYLLTGIIWKELKAGSFSIAQFYVRRIRRIIPALLILLIAVTGLSTIVLLPNDLGGFGRSVIASLLFIPNIYFWRDTNYFSSAADEKPLLNLWSLGIEEQFYLLLPLVLLYLTKGVSRRAILVISLLVVLSFALNWVAILVGASGPAFYLLPTRAWELGIGSALALLPKGPARPWLAMSGWAIMICSMALPIRGFLGSPDGILSVFGATLAIWAGAPQESAFGQVIASRPVNLLGRISYSLYLWHWPLIVIYSYYIVREPSPIELSGVAAVSLLVAYISWAFVEQPFRNQSMPFRRVGVILLSGTAITALSSVLLISSQGLPNRLPEEAARINAAVGTHYRCEVSRLFPFGASRACDLSLGEDGIEGARIALLGNSHAQMYAPLLREYGQENGLSVALVPLNACLPTVSLNISIRCLNQAKTNLASLLELPHLETVVIAHNWPTEALLVSADGSKIEGANLIAEATISLADRLHEKGIEVIIVGPLLRPMFDVASILSRQIAFGHDERVSRDAPRREWELNYRSSMAVLGDASHQIIRPDLVQCSADRCVFVGERGSLFADSGHLSQLALPMFQRTFYDALNNNLLK